MFKARKIKRIKDMMVKSAKKNPDRLINCFEYMIVWSSDRNEAIFLPGNYAGLTNYEIDLAIAQRLKATA